MNDRLIPPQGSKIDVNQNQNLTIISWEKYPTFGRYFLALALAIPFIFTIASAPMIIEKITHQDHWSSNLFFLVLILFNIKILMILWKYIRPTMPESICFDSEQIQFYSGDHPFDQGRVYSHTFRRSDCPKLQLQTVGSKQRLCFYDADRPVLIGQGLTKQERSWIFDVVNNWAIG